VGARPAGHLDLGRQRRHAGYAVFLPQVRGDARDRLDQPANADPSEELVVNVRPQFLIVRCRPARVVGVSEPGDDPSQPRQGAALRLGLTADEFS
jgi:hypothetical protein